MHAIVPIIIILIIVVQLFFFVKNFLRMRQFSNIFTDTASWRLRRNEETSLVDGVYGNGNGIFTAIISSINKYLEKNSGSVIDFGLLKDAVDRHCDSVENDIAVQTPIPLYWGLAGTMAGVIMGVFLQFVRKTGASLKHSFRQLLRSLLIDLFHTLYDFKKPRSSRNPIYF